MKKSNFAIADGITAFSTLRDSANYNGNYNGFNTCGYVNDDPGHVESCRKELALELGVDEKELIIPHQTHSANVEIVDSLFDTDSPELDNLDALVTDLPGKPLIIHTADCVPLFLVDPVIPVVAIVHGGWKGLVNGIVENTIANMINLGAKPARILAQLGPHISARNYEVGEEMKSVLSPDELIAENGKYYADLNRLTVNRLMKVGVRPENIKESGQCTFADEENLYSARRDGIDTGRIASVIMINP
ncbi:MAG: peptidoglycan editing factor PgeF [Paramuribaculum sp.]|nr:peptidoglycan editing factor PgeF [Paramuribaculum sp.]